jgi:hypothetical protein
MFGTLSIPSKAENLTTTKTFLRAAGETARMLSHMTTTSRRILGSTEFDGFAIRVRHNETAPKPQANVRLVR